MKHADIIKQMTLEEKVRQIDQYSPSDLTCEDRETGDRAVDYEKLKEMGAGDIYLYITHCENTILDGDILNGDLIEKVYTTESIFTKEHEKIYVIKTKK